MRHQAPIKTAVGTILQFPTIESKIKRLDELKARYLALAEESEELIEEAFRGSLARKK